MAQFFAPRLLLISALLVLGVSAGIVWYDMAHPEVAAKSYGNWLIALLFVAAISSALSFLCYDIYGDKEFRIVGIACLIITVLASIVLMATVMVLIHVGFKSSERATGYLILMPLGYSFAFLLWMLFRKPAS